MLRNAVALRRGRARDFLVFGRMLKPVQVEGVKIVHWEHDRQVNDIPAVVHSAWQSPRGQFAAVVANWTGETQAVVLRDPRLGQRVQETRSAENVSTRLRTVDRGALSVSLEPLSCALIEKAR